MSPRNYHEQLAAKHSSHIDAILPYDQSWLLAPQPELRSSNMFSRAQYGITGKATHHRVG